MKKNIVITGIFALMIIAPVTFTGCVDRTEERVEVQKDNTTPAVVVPDTDKDVNVNVHTDNTAPDVIHHDSSTNTTTTQDSNTGSSTTTQTQTDSVH